jgi:hypothetical protein
MQIVNPMFHMDSDYLWRWYITDAGGKSVGMSADSFFRFEDARRNYDDMRRRLM